MILSLVRLNHTIVERGGTDQAAPMLKSSTHLIRARDLSTFATMVHSLTILDIAGSGIEPELDGKPAEIRPFEGQVVTEFTPNSTSQSKTIPTALDIYSSDDTSDPAVFLDRSKPLEVVLEKRSLLFLDSGSLGQRINRDLDKDSESGPSPMIVVEALFDCIRMAKTDTRKLFAHITFVISKADEAQVPKLLSSPFFDGAISDTSDLDFLDIRLLCSSILPLQSEESSYPEEGEEYYELTWRWFTLFDTDYESMLYGDLPLNCLVLPDVSGAAPWTNRYIRDLLQLMNTGQLDRN